MFGMGCGAGLTLFELSLAVAWAAPTTTSSVWWVSASGSAAANCTQPWPCARVQSAVDRARDGDSVHILAGQYACEAVVINKTLALVGVGADGPVEFDCGRTAQAQAFRFVDVGVSLSGLTIRRGNASSAATVFVQLSAVTAHLQHSFRDMTFIDNAGRAATRALPCPLPACGRCVHDAARSGSSPLFVWLVCGCAVCLQVLSA